MTTLSELRAVPRIDAARREIPEALPLWMASWWRWVDGGLRGWLQDVWTIVGWGLIGAVLVVASPVALIGRCASHVVKQSGYN